MAFLTFSCETDLALGDFPEDQVITDPTAPSPDAAEALALEALDRVNALRAEGCNCGGEFFGPTAPLSLHPQLQRTAVLHSADQASRGRMSHQGSDGSRVGDRLSAQGYNWRTVGENVAWNQRSVAQVVAAWKSSTGHCKNIMNPAFTQMGLAVEDWYWTQVLAR